MPKVKVLSVYMKQVEVNSNQRTHTTFNDPYRSNKLRGGLIMNKQVRLNKIKETTVIPAQCNII